MILLNMAIVQLQRKKLEEARTFLQQINPMALEQRAYLYHGTWAEYYWLAKQSKKAIKSIDAALALVRNAAERAYLLEKTG